MATSTPNYGLIKPGGSDAPDLPGLNPNWDKVDLELKKNADNIGLLDVRHGNTDVQIGFNCNINDRGYRLVPVYNGVNAPDSGIGMLEHIPYSPDWVLQRFFSFNTLQHYYRHFSQGTTWSAWVG